MAVSYKSDYIRPTGNGGGRPFDTHGARFDNGMVFVNEGLSHEENPNGGVQVGVDENGKPNLVEQGEVIVDLGGGPYVMSQRLRLGREDLLMAGLPVKYAGKTCAEAATGMQRESEERPLDEISMRGLRAMLERLAAVQETYRDDIGASGTQNLNLGQDLYGARAQAVGSEEEMGQMPIESEAEGGYAAYGGWSLKKKDMPPYGYYQYGSIPENGYAPRYDGLQNIPPQSIGFINGALVGPYVGVPTAPCYPAAYPYPTAPVQRQMAYGGYRFAGDEPQYPKGTIDFGNGVVMVPSGGGYMYHQADGSVSYISGGEAQDEIAKLNAQAAASRKAVENANAAGPYIGGSIVRTGGSREQEGAGDSLKERSGSESMGVSQAEKEKKRANGTSKSKSASSGSSSSSTDALREDIRFKSDLELPYGAIGYDPVTGKPIYPSQIVGAGNALYDIQGTTGKEGVTDVDAKLRFVSPEELAARANTQAYGGRQYYRVW